MVDQYYQLLKTWITGQEIPSKDLQELAVWEYEDVGRRAAFGISSAKVTDLIIQKAHLWQSVYPEVRQYCQNAQLSEPIIIETLWNCPKNLSAKLCVNISTKKY